VNERDKLHHEAEVCDFRKLICHDCSEVKDLLYQLLARQDQMKDEIKAEVEGVMNDTREKIQNEMNGMKECNVEFKSEMKEIKNEIKAMKDEMHEKTKEINIGIRRMRGEIDETREELQKKLRQILACT
jgi:chromosome segregation ATPase